MRLISDLKQNKKSYKNLKKNKTTKIKLSILDLKMSTKLAIFVAMLLCCTSLTVFSKEVEKKTTIPVERQNELEKMKYLFNLHLDYNEIINENAFKSDFYMKRKLLKVKEQLDKIIEILRKFIYEKPNNPNEMMKIIKQVLKERKKSESNVNKEKSASDYFQSVTGNWG